MKKSPALALVCAVVLAPLTACGPDTGRTAADGSKPPRSTSDTRPNGIQARSAKEIYEAGTKANAASGSFRMQSKSTETESDIRVSVTECVGEVHLLKNEEGVGGSFDLIQKGNDVWEKFDKQLSDEFKREGKKIPADEWLHGTPETPLLKIALSRCHRSKLTAPDRGDNYMKKGSVASIDGVPVIHVISSGSGGTATYSIATSGKPNLIERAVNRADQETISYSKFGEPVGAKKPSGKITEAPLTD
ncbi:hypothetical protein [Streptomyces celluloflavus]|uniref:hypothetical protein n=1 Tax=Streptomyces celluloflavus TaxID=58344 RepID=UPI00364C6EA0